MSFVVSVVIVINSNFVVVGVIDGKPLDVWLVVYLFIVVAVAVFFVVLVDVNIVVIVTVAAVILCLVQFF